MALDPAPARVIVAAGEPAAKRETLTRCPVCLHDHFSYQFTHAGLPIVRCDGCTLLMRNPQPSDAELQAIYNDGYFFGASASAETDQYEAEFARLKQSTAAAYLDRVERYQGWDAKTRRGCRLLDLGSGLGDLLVEARARGYDVAGVEYSASAVARANARLGASVVRQGTLETAGPDEASCDVCMLSDVIEHTRDPMRVLDHVWRVLKPGGVIFVATPSLDSWSARLLRDRWMEFKAEHLFFFDSATLESALVRAGFEQMRIAPGRKTLSPEYILHHFQRFPVPVLSPLGRATGAMLPRSLRHRRLRVVASGIDVVARRAKTLPVDRRRARVSVVMPVFNEKQTFAEVIGRLIVKQVANLDLEIVIVESNSTDGTREDVRQLEGHPRVTVIWQERPTGKGNAVRAGLSRVTGDFVLIQDADLEYDLDDYEMLLEPLRTFRRAFVLGIRHGRDGHSWKMRHFTDQVLLGRWMNLGHLIFTGLFNIVYGQRLRDPFTMFKVFRRECLSGLQFECNAFDFDWELAGKLVRCGYEPLEIPVNYKSRSFAEGKKVTMIRDPLTWLRACFKYRFSPLKDDRPDNRPDDLI
jgi:2-polyprenyl-3-methyl-5-hydroxy-6-metoxy-1,4-benzoquinol methylase